MEREIVVAALAVVVTLVWVLLVLVAVLPFQEVPIWMDWLLSELVR